MRQIKEALLVSSYWNILGCKEASGPCDSIVVATPANSGPQNVAAPGVACRVTQACSDRVEVDRALRIIIERWRISAFELEEWLRDTPTDGFTQGIVALSRISALG